MKFLKITGALLLALVLSTGAKAQTEAKDQKEQLVVPLSEPGKPFKLNVGLLNGSIRVITHEGKDVIIETETEEQRKKSEARDRDRGMNVNVNGNSNASNGMKKISPAGGLDISAEERNNNVTVHAETMRRSVSLLIKVPQSEATMHLSTVNNGEISVTNVSGELEIDNTNGSIYLNNVSGSAVANTTNGKIIATFKTIDPKRQWRFLL